MQTMPLRKKCPYSELFWFAFSNIRTECGGILHISPYLVRMQKKEDQNNSEYGHFLRSAHHPTWGKVYSVVYFNGILDKFTNKHTMHRNRVIQWSCGCVGVTREYTSVYVIRFRTYLRYKINIIRQDPGLWAEYNKI